MLIRPLWVISHYNDKSVGYEVTLHNPPQLRAFVFASCQALLTHRLR